MARNESPVITIADVLSDPKNVSGRNGAINDAEAQLRKGRRGEKMLVVLDSLGLLRDGDHRQVSSIPVSNRDGDTTDVEVSAYKFRDPRVNTVRTALIPSRDVLRGMVMNAAPQDFRR